MSAALGAESRRLNNLGRSLQRSQAEHGQTKFDVSFRWLLLGVHGTCSMQALARLIERGASVLYVEP